MTRAIVTPCRIIDANCHWWDLGAKHRYPWLMEGGALRFFGNKAPIQRDYLVEDFQTDIGHVWGIASIASCGNPSANLAARLDVHQKAEALRSIRQIGRQSAKEDRQTGSAALLGHPVFLAGLKLLTKRDLFFDLQLIPARIECAATLFEQVPEQGVVRCHAGTLSDLSPGGDAPLQIGNRRLSKIANQICKLSCFGIFNKKWSVQSVEAQLETILEAFRSEWTALSSNFPVNRLAMSDTDVWYRYFESSDELGIQAIASTFKKMHLAFTGCPMPTSTPFNPPKLTSSSAELPPHHP